MKKREKGLSSRKPLRLDGGKFEFEIPSRETLRQHLSLCAGAQTVEQVAEALNFTAEQEISALQKRLGAMARDGLLHRNRKDGYAPVESVHLLRGRVQGHRDGHGWLLPDDGSAKVGLSNREMQQLFDGDKVLVHLRGNDRRGRPYGAVVDVLERHVAEIVGRYYEESRIGYVVPDNPRLAHQILIPAGATAGASHEQIVTVKITAQPSKRSQPVGEIVEVVGDHMAPGMEIDIALRAWNIPFEWPKDVLEQANALGTEVLTKDKADRTDFRDLPLVTIDGEDARDFDDAVYAEKSGRGWRLLVAIADVAHYVRYDTALDFTAQERGTSVYFPGEVVPMLPVNLSNGLCSLNPQVDRLALVCEMKVNQDGKVTKAQFHKGLICSAARLTYTQVAAMLADKDADIRAQYPDCIESIDALHQLYKAFLKIRQERGGIEFNTQDTRIVFGENRKIERLEVVERNDAHRLIEECMIAANVQAAKFLKKNKMPTLFRVHESPSAQSLEDVRTFLGELGLSLGGGDDPQPTDYTRLISQVQGRVDAGLVETVLLRSMSQAKYSPQNDGHFGLALECYGHFTSPIRRYPDLLVHRALHHLVSGGTAADFRYVMSDMDTFSEHTSMAERRAEDATRDVTSWLKCEFMRDRIGDTFEALITGVTSFGLFVQLDGVHVEGLVHITALDSDYYNYDPIGHRLCGERTGKIWRLADKMTVKVVRVDLDERNIDLEPVATTKSRSKKKRAPRRKNK